MIDDLDHFQGIFDLSKINILPRKKTIDDVILNPERRKEFKDFKFPEDFSFHNEEHREAVARLYCRKNYGTKTKEQKEIRAAVRDNYRQKCKEYFIEQYGWPKKNAGIISKMVFLPNCRDQKTKAGHIAMFIPAALGGHLPIKYAEPLSKMMNVDREYLTASSIAWDIVNFGIASYISIKIWTGEPHPEDLMERIYSIFDGGKDVFKWMITANALTRSLELPVRVYKYEKDKSHTYSPAAMFPLNPNLIDAVPLTWLMGRDLYVKFKERTKNYDISFNGMKNGFRKEAIRAEISENMPIKETEDIAV